MITTGPHNIVGLDTQQATNYFKAFAHSYLNRVQASGSRELSRYEQYFQQNFNMTCSIWVLLHNIIDDLS